MRAKIEKLMQLKADKRIHNYEFSMGAVIGRGSYGVVYAGRNTDNGYTLI
jgi:serine/threonine-protein kinase ULK/ATG1